MLWRTRIYWLRQMVYWKGGRVHHHLLLHLPLRTPPCLSHLPRLQGHHLHRSRLQVNQVQVQVQVLTLLTFVALRRSLDQVAADVDEGAAPSIRRIVWFWGWTLRQTGSSQRFNLTVGGRSKTVGKKGSTREKCCKCNLKLKHEQRRQCVPHLFHPPRTPFSFAYLFLVAFLVAQFVSLCSAVVCVCLYIYIFFIYFFQNNAEFFFSQLRGLV